MMLHTTLVHLPLSQSKPINPGMKRILILFAFFAGIVGTASAQQKVAKNEADYQMLKAAGENPAAPAQPKAATIKPTVFSPATLKLGGGGSIGTDCQCIQTIDETFTIAPFTNGTAPEYRNDDGSTAEIDLPFTFSLYGTDYTSCFINNNGNISFNNAYSTFSSSAFPTASFVMVAPFWADVDTRNTQSGLVYYKVTDHSLTVIWDAVGYFNSQADKVNTFQLVITDGTDPVVPDGNNVSFCYGDMQWTTGSASSGVNGFAGTPATVGANLGDGTSFIQFGRFDHPGSDYDGPFNNADGVSWLDNTNFNFNSDVITGAGNIAPIVPSGSLCDTLYVCAGSNAYLQFLSPEQDQVTDLIYEVIGANNLVLTETQDQGSSELQIFAPLDAPNDTLLINVSGTDNGTPAMSTSTTYVLVVRDQPEPITITASDVELCTGETITLSIADTYTSVSWSTGGSTNSINVTAGGTVTVTANDQFCETTGEIEIVQLPSPTPTIGGVFQACGIGTTDIFVNETYPAVVWSNNLTTTTIAAGSGTYTVTATGDNGCQGTSAPVTVLIIPTPTISVPDIQFCVSDRPLNASIINSVSGVNYTYVWDASPNLTSTTVANPNVTGLTADATFTVTAYPTAYPDCSSQEEVTVTLVDTPVMVTDDEVVYCNNGLQLDASVENVDPTFTYNWTWTPSNFFSGANTSSPSLVGIIPSGTVVTGTVAVSWDAQCRDQQEVTVLIPNAPESFPAVIDSMCVGSPLNLVAGTPSVPVDYQWFYYIVTPQGNDSIILLGNEQIQEVVSTGIFYVEMSEPACGFTSVSPFYVNTYACDIFIPDVITPNGDGLNETFVIESLELFPNSTLKIFDRWGGLVYESTDYKNNWGDPDAPEGTYYFILEWVKDEQTTTPISGYFTLLH
jgi:gliding motility-associated-like protein